MCIISIINLIVMRANSKYDAAWPDIMAEVFTDAIISINSLTKGIVIQRKRSPSCS